MHKSSLFGDIIQNCVDFFGRYYQLMEKIKKAKLHYGWIIFGTCFLMVFCTLGFCSSTKGLFLAPATADTGLPRSMFSLGDCCRYVTVAFLNMSFGKLVEKFGPRKLVVAGFIFLGASMTTYSLSSTVLGFCLGGVLLGCGMAFTTTTIVGYFVEKWFTKSKGTIMGIILAANGLGSAVAAQILSPIIESGVHGWRTGYRTSGIIVVCVGVLVCLLLRNKPEDMKLEPLGQNGKVKESDLNDWMGREFSEIRKKPQFWMTLLCCLMYGLIIQSYSGCSSAHFRDVGLDAKLIANILSLHSIFLFIAKTSTGFLFDRFGLRTVLIFSSLCVVGAVSILSAVGPDSVKLPYLYAVVSAFGLPIETIMMPLLTRDMFGVRSYAKIMGIIVGVVQLGMCFGSIFTNAWFDRFGSYKMIFNIFAVATIVITIVMNLLITDAHTDRKKYKKEQKLLKQKKN